MSQNRIFSLKDLYIKHFDRVASKVRSTEHKGYNGDRCGIWQWFPKWSPEPAIPEQLRKVWRVLVLRLHFSPTKTDIWGVRSLVCAFKSISGEPGAYSQLRTTGLVIKSLTFGARWLYYLGQFIFLLLLFPACKMQQHRIHIVVMKIKWAKLCKILRTRLGHCKHPTMTVMTIMMIFYAGFILFSVHHQALVFPDISSCILQWFSMARGSISTQWSICIRTTYNIKMQALKCCPDPRDKNSLVTLFHVEISKPLVLDHKDGNHNFANEQMRPKYRTCLRK